MQTILFYFTQFQFMHPNIGYQTSTVVYTDLIFQLILKNYDKPIINII